MSAGSRRRPIIIGLGLVVSLGLLYLSFRNIEFSDVVSEVAKVNLSILALAVVIRAFNFGVMALRSRVLLARVHRYTLWELFKSTVLAFAVNNVVPLRAGELARVAYLSRRGSVDAGTCLAAIALERLLDLMVLGALFVFTFWAAAVDVPLGGSVYVLVAAVAVAVTGALWVSLRPQPFVTIARSVARLFGRRFSDMVQRRAEGFAEGLSALRSVSAVTGVILLTVVLWLASTLGVQTWIWAMGLQLPWYAPVVVMAFLTLGVAVPATPGQIGTFHFFTAAALLFFDVEQTVASSFGVVGHAVTIIPFTVLAIPLLSGDYLRIGKAKAAPPRSESDSRA